MSVQGKQVGGQPGKHAKGSIEDDAVCLKLVMECIAMNLHNGEIKTKVAAIVGKKPRSIEKYITRARALLRAEIDQPLADLRASSYALYKSILKDSKSTTHEKLKAQASIDRLLGLSIAHNSNWIPGTNGATGAATTEAEEAKPKDFDTSRALGQIKNFYGLTAIPGGKAPAASGPAEGGGGQSASGGTATEKPA